MSDELNFEALLSQIEDNINHKIIGHYKFTELSMSELRKMTNVGFNPIELPAKISNLFNEYISNAVENVEDIIDLSDEITLDLKPFFICVLREITLGNVFVDQKTNKKYLLKTIEEKELTPSIEPKIVSFGDFNIFLKVPTLKKDTFYNNEILRELTAYKKTLNDEDYGKIADLYQIYEIIKYITKIDLKNESFDFERCPINKKIKIINKLPQRTITEISNYIDSVREKESEAFAALEVETGESIIADMYSLFFVKSTHQK